MGYRNTYKGIFSKKFKKCKSRKDYKKLCREMISQFDVIDHVDDNQYKIFTSMIGEEAYLGAIALSLKMLLLEEQGYSTDIITYERDIRDL